MKPVTKESHFDRAVLGDILARVHLVAGRAFVVALDGPGGSGKSMLARELAAAYDLSLVISLVPEIRHPQSCRQQSTSDGDK
jgi:putative protein kinase ArgK-like GTPase of G3E family